jgi:hypothetical protein
MQIIRQSLTELFPSTTFNPAIHLHLRHKSLFYPTPPPKLLESSKRQYGR